MRGGAGSESADASDADAQALTPAAAGPAAAASQEVQAPETHAEATEGRALSPSGGGGDTTTLSSSSVWKRPFHQPEARERSPLPGPSILPARPTFMSRLPSRRTATTGGPSSPAPWCEGEGRPQTTEPFTEDFSRTVARAWAAWRELSQPSVRAARGGRPGDGPPAGRPHLLLRPERSQRPRGSEHSARWSQAVVSASCPWARPSGSQPDPRMSHRLSPHGRLSPLVTGGQAGPTLTSDPAPSHRLVPGTDPQPPSPVQAAPPGGEMRDEKWAGLQAAERTGGCYGNRN